MVSVERHCQGDSGVGEIQGRKGSGTISMVRPASLFSAYVCVYGWVGACVCVYVYVCVCVHVCSCIHVFVCVWVCVCHCVCVYMYVCHSMCMCVSLYVCVRARVCVCVHACVCYGWNFNCDITSFVSSVLCPVL